MSKDYTSPAAKGKRVRDIREWLQLTRPAIQRKYGIKLNTLQGWEDGRRGGLSQAGAKQLVELFNAENVPCTIEWLLFGSGKSPLPANFKSKASENLSNSVDFAIAQELSNFRQTHPDSADMIISDDGMAPCFVPGDHVAGQRYFGQAIHNAVNQCCIVHTQKHGILVRLLTAGTQQGRYTLSCCNPQTSAKQPTLQDIAVFSAAPIIWFRRPKIIPA